MFLADINQERVIGRLCSGCGNRKVGEWFERERQQLSRGGGIVPRKILKTIEPRKCDFLRFRHQIFSSSFGKLAGSGNRTALERLVRKQSPAAKSRIGGSSHAPSRLCAPP